MAGESGSWKPFAEGFLKKDLRKEEPKYAEQTFSAPGVAL